MTRYRDNQGLVLHSLLKMALNHLLLEACILLRLELLNLHLFLRYEFSYLFRSFIPVHLGHVAIHKNNPVETLVLVPQFFEVLKSLVAVIDTVDPSLEVLVSRFDLIVRR